MLCLSRDQVEEFTQLVPGFKALVMSTASYFTAKGARAKQHYDEEDTVRMTREQQSLRFAIQWARMVAKLLGEQTVGSLTAITIQQVRQRETNSLDWVHELVARESDESSRAKVARGGSSAPADSDGEEEAVPRLDPAEKPRNEASDVMRHHQPPLTNVDSHLMSKAAGRAWRASWSPGQQIRSEQVREDARSGDMARASTALAHLRPKPLPDTFPSISSPQRAAKPARFL